MEPANRLSVLSLNELSLQCRLQLQHGLQLQRRLQLQREDSLQRRSVQDPSGARTTSPVPPTRHDSPLTDVGDESQYLKPRPIFVLNIKAFFSTDSDYESFKSRINEVAAQHLEMERYLDHQDEDPKKKFLTKYASRSYLTIDYPFLKKCPECWPVAFCLQMKLHNNMNRANKRASAEAIATLKSIAPAAAQVLFAPQKHEKLGGFGGSRLAVFSATEAREARRVACFGLFATETFGCFFFFPPQKHRKLGGSHLAGRSTLFGSTTPFVLLWDVPPWKLIAPSVLASPWVFHCLLKTTLCAGPIIDYEAARNFSQRYGFFPSTLPPQKDTSINRPEPSAFILGIVTANFKRLHRIFTHRHVLRKPLRVLHYSTSRPTARWTTVSTIFQNSRADALRYPVVENVCHRDADRQPWIHDFDVTLEHGQKVASFRIFLKCSITLLPNKYSDAIVGDIVIMCLAARNGNKVVNVRSTDRPTANYIFNEALQRMKDFQSKKRICLPPVLELTLEGNPPFPV
ncbi:hypothetical protein B0H14DRAFT_2631766 [Mycena olivaceomarginata]|nr:hypothetical protein B0H14DRAFT_2631766 [Mycena olivaceomarginata]